LRSGKPGHVGGHASSSTRRRADSASTGARA
jgi:hypothetical protein